MIFFRHSISVEFAFLKLIYITVRRYYRQKKWIAS